MIKDKIRELESLTSYLKDEEKKVIIKAINFSEIAHKDQTRKSGDPYIIHPIEVAKILTSINIDSSAIAAGLLHDTIEDTIISINEITETFGSQISELVQGLTKISKFDLRINKQKLGENYRKLILASSKDLRVILI
ncbi:HD domain-containing protein, partial [Alphaproteobacteria bacterium]|nr:HD domain-containing protein [Alphaproteobacteria bacterium]